MKSRDGSENERVCARVDLGAIRHNLRLIGQRTAPGQRIMAIIKADGYGHGAAPIARMLEKEKQVWGYGTATAQEAFALRAQGIRKPILVLGYTFPSDYPEMIRKNIRATVFREEQLFWLEEQMERVRAQEEARGLKRRSYARVHIAVETGMSRIGIMPDDEGIMFCVRSFHCPGVKAEGIFSHYACADEADLSFAGKQREVFTRFVRRAEKRSGARFPLVHLSNSAGIVSMPPTGNLVRPGIMLYGLWPSAETAKACRQLPEPLSLRPALSLHSHIVCLKEVPAGTPVSYGATYVTERTTRLATVPVGYGDGYPRSLSNRGYVLIRGKKAPIRGRVCMDQCMVDVTEIPGVRENDAVTLLGENGGERISAETLGELSGRFNYELVCDINARVQRVYTFSPAF